MPVLPSRTENPLPESGTGAGSRKNRRHGKGVGQAPFSDAIQGPVGDRGTRDNGYPRQDGYDERWGPHDERKERVRRTLLTLLNHTTMTLGVQQDDARDSVAPWA